MVSPGSILQLLSKPINNSFSGIPEYPDLCKFYRIENTVFANTLFFDKLTGMAQRDKLDPNSPAYTNSLLEDMDDKFQAILEATAPIPQIQDDLGKLKTINVSVKQRLDSWEANIELIPPMFEEVGSLCKDVEILKEALQLLGKRDNRLASIEQRLSVVEQQIH